MQKTTVWHAVRHGRMGNCITTAVCLCAILLSTVSYAASGSWSQQKHDMLLPQGNLRFSSPPLSPQGTPIGNDARITRVQWRYQTLNPVPAGFNARLCSPQRCIDLLSNAGQTTLFQNEKANVPFHFIFWLEGRKTPYPPVRLMNYQVLVDYR